jgi:hypothetical protein
MASYESPNTGAFPETEVAVRPARRPFYKDPLSILGWGIAFAAVVAYWYFFVHKPVPKPGQQIARFTAVEGKVKLKPNAKEVWNDVRLSDQLHVGDVVQTENRAGAEISFNSGSVVRVRPASIVYIGGSAEASTAAWRVQSGRVNFAVGDETTEIVTPTARTMAQSNAAGNIDVSEKGDTGVKIFHGSAEIETKQGQRITLNENQAVQVDAAGKAGAKLELPPPPMPVSPQSKAMLPVVAPPEPSAHLVWRPVKNGDTYRVSMDFNVTQANLLLSAALDQDGIRQTSHNLLGLEPGRYFWRVSAVNKDGLEGASSRVSYFAVVVPAVPQPVVAPTTEAGPLLTLQAVEEVAPGVVHVGGRTRPGSTVTVDGTPIKVMPDGSFSEYVHRAGPGELMVRVTAADGEVTEQTRSVAKR